MGDLISRQAAIEIIDGYMNRLAKHIGTPTDNERYAYARGTLLGVETGVNALPSIVAVPQWIPVTERLPEEGIVVVTVDKDGDYEINAIIDEEEGEWFLGKAIAWMPLPKTPMLRKGER